MGQLAIAGALVFDGKDTLPFGEAIVLVEGERIAWLGPARDAPVGWDRGLVIDGTGQTLLPGLINCHVHLSADPDPRFLPAVALADSPALATLRAARNARLTLQAGETTVCDMGSTKPGIVIDLAKAIAQGLVPGPRVLAAGSAICMTGGHGWFIGREADGPDEVRKAAREQLKLGADLVNLMATGGVLTPGLEVGGIGLSETEMRAGVEEAHNAGKRTATHAIGTAGVKNALRAGIDSVEHGCLLDDECIELLLKSGAYYVPTLAAVTQIVRNASHGQMADYAVHKARQVYERHCASFKQAAEAGARIAAGTDASTPYNPHGGLALEVELMVENGYTARQALRSATSEAARLLGLADQVGALEVGRQADLLLVAGDALSDVRALNAVRAVVKAGGLVGGGAVLAGA